MVDGVELANGWSEIRDAPTQVERHAREARAREDRGLPAMATDPGLLAALAEGLPACAGVALGFDRLVMLMLGEDDLGKAVAFGDDLV